LENTRRIILLCCRLHLLHILGAVTGQRILGVIRIVQVEIWVVSADTLSILANPVNEICTCALEEGILFCALPRDVGLVD
jgi:hypothetical protein